MQHGHLFRALPLPKAENKYLILFVALYSSRCDTHLPPHLSSFLVVFVVQLLRGTWNVSQPESKDSDSDPDPDLTLLGAGSLVHFKAQSHRGRLHKCIAAPATVPARVLGALSPGHVYTGFKGRSGEIHPPESQEARDPPESPKSKAVTDSGCVPGKTGAMAGVGQIAPRAGLPKPVSTWRRRTGPHRNKPLPGATVSRAFSRLASAPLAPEAPGEAAPGYGGGRCKWQLRGQGDRRRKGPCVEAMLPVLSGHILEGVAFLLLSRRPGGVEGWPGLTVRHTDAN